MDNQFNRPDRQQPTPQPQPQPTPQPQNPQSADEYQRQQYQAFQSIPQPELPKIPQDEPGITKTKSVKKKSRFKWLVIVLISTLLLAVVAIAGSYLWYQSQLQPYDASNQERISVSIAEGMVGSQVADQLEERKLINSALAMKIYLRVNGSGEGFKTGVYSVSPSQDTSEIISHLVSGQPDQRAITFFPGAMLVDNSNTDQDKKTDVTSVLKRAGYSDLEIKRALAADYTSPVLADLPVDASVEGYVYGETYFIDAAASAEQVIQRAINELAKVVEENDLKSKFAAKGLSLHEGIILASIVQRESIGCPGQAICKDQQDIASVFYNRLDSGMNLGSDVTYHYVADRDGIARDFNLDSPYNTRKHPGLPPGPIAVPGISALNAVANPSSTEYLYFLSGDDDITYFGKTNEDHEANIRNHCNEKCLLP